MEVIIYGPETHTHTHTWEEIKTQNSRLCEKIKGKL